MFAVMSGFGLWRDSPSRTFAGIISRGSRANDSASMWWLCFERDGRFLGVALVEGETLAAARLRATVSGIAAGAKFTVGHPLDERCRAMLTPEETGRMLSAAEAAEL